MLHNLPPIANTASDNRASIDCSRPPQKMIGVEIKFLQFVVTLNSVMTISSRVNSSAGHFQDYVGNPILSDDDSVGSIPSISLADKGDDFFDWEKVNHSSSDEGSDDSIFGQEDTNTFGRNLVGMIVDPPKGN